MKKHIVRAGATSLALASALVTPALAAPGSSSAYATDSQTSHVEDATSEGIGEVNLIACIMAALRPDALVNEGPYIALVDKNKCDSNKRSSTSNSGATSDGAQVAASYVTATVNSTRASNTDPMITKTWLELEEEGFHQTIFVHISATEAPSASNAYGVFRLDYCGKVDGISGCPSRGYLEGTASGLNFYQLDDNGQDSQTTALRLVTASATGGSGRLQKDSPYEHSAFTFGYDANLYRREDDNGDQCFSRDAADADAGLSVWRYGVYDSDTGARITRSSGFPIEFTSGGTTFNGYLGYYGLSLPFEALSALTNGSTVDKVEYSNNGSGAPTRTSYTVVKSDGKLMKYTRKTRTLHAMDQIKFSTFVDMNANAFFAGAQPNSQYEIYWDEQSGHFVASARMNCNENGCQTEELPSVQPIALSYWASRGGVQGYSQSLGGEVFVNLQGVSEPVTSSAVQVVYRQQDLVYPADLPTTLFCVQNCPTQASMQAYFTSNTDSPYEASTYNNWLPTQAGSVVTYGTDAATATLRDGASAVVAFGDAEAYRQHPMYQSGLRSGRLFTQMSDAECSAGSGTYCDYKVNDAEVFYQWETGPNAWNQFAAVKDSSGNFVTFDAPLQLSYNVPSGSRYGVYSGKSIVLQYGGFGDLWGIPGVCVSRLTNAQVNCSEQGSRYVPSFVIPYDTTLGQVSDGTKSYLVKWLDREIRFAQKPLSACTNAGLTVPSNVTLPTSADLKDPSDASSSVYIGTKPTVTSAPRVIHGDVKY